MNWSKYCVKLPEVDRTDWLDDFKQTLNILKEIDSNPENVRCVFFFDSIWDFKFFFQKVDDMTVVFNLLGV